MSSDKSDHDESDHTEESLPVFEKNISRLLSQAYEPERPTDEFVEQAVGRMLGRAQDNAARRRRDRLVFWRWTSVWDHPKAWLAAGLIVLVGVLTIGFCARQIFPRTTTIQQIAALTVDDSELAVATLVSAVDAVWSTPLEESSRLGPGLLELKEGVAQLVFAKGAVVSLEGPVSLELINDGLCRLLSGAVAAKVSADAIGFTVLTADMRIIDLGTAFGVRVGRDASTEVHVFDGEVDLVATPGSDRDSNPLLSSRLLGGEALRLVPSGKPISIKADPTLFIKNDDVARRVDQRRERARLRWVEYSQRWNKDPAVVLRYDFDAISDGSILNTANPDMHQATPANASPRLIEGRWPGKRAMLFDGRTDMLTVADHEDLRLENDLSLAIWMRSNDQPYDGWTRIVGKGVGTSRNFGLWCPANQRFVWQLCPVGDFEWWDTELTTRPLEQGKWRLLVGVLADDMAKIYVDGRLELARAMERPIATSHDPMTIGYYTDVPAHEGHYYGEIDELILLNRALAAREILSMYEAGKPE